METTAVRFTKDHNLSLQQVDEQAALLGCSRNELIQKGIELVTHMDAEFIKEVEEQAKTIAIPVWLFAQNILIKWMAENQARLDIGQKERALLEFMFTSNGPVTGRELFDHLRSFALQDLVSEIQRTEEV